MNKAIAYVSGVMAIASFAWVGFGLTLALWHMLRAIIVSL